MGKLFLFVSIAVGIGFSANVVRAMPPASDPNPNSLIAPVADGFGFNKYRDARGICRRKYVMGGRYEKRPLYGACGGVNSHRVCNLYGHCWMVCD